MIDYREMPETGVVEIRIDGRVSREAFDRVASKLEAFIECHGKVRVLEIVDSFGGMDPSVFWDDLKFGLRHLNDFSRCAVVTEKRWVEVMTKAVRPFVSCEIELYHHDEIETARTWLNAPDVKEAAAR